jgi:hypothetical protein
LQHPWVTQKQTFSDQISLSLVELLQLSSDSSSSMFGENNVSEDFQQKQIDRIVEAIALTLPNGGI